MTQQASSLKERQRQQREQLILQATADVLTEKGYDAMSMEDVASRVGISRAAIYLHFPSKEDLVLALLQHGIETSTERLDALLAEKMPPREKVRAIIERSYGSKQQPSFQVFNALMHSPTFFSKAAEKRTTMGDLWQPTVQRLTALLEQGKRTGDFDPDMPTQLMVGLLTTLLSPFTKHMFEHEPIPMPVVVNYLCRYFLKGIAPDHPGAAPEGEPQASTLELATYPDGAIDK
jgi:TetR/AcrR family transcriptional regulator, fatty acid metabolism regulator protein